MLEMYGIPNCDTLRKARRWLDDHALAFIEVDFSVQRYEALFT